MASVPGCYMLRVPEAELVYVRGSSALRGTLRKGDLLSRTPVGRDFSLTAESPAKCLDLILSNRLCGARGEGIGDSQRPPRMYQHLPHLTLVISEW